MQVATPEPRRKHPEGSKFPLGPFRLAVQVGQQLVVDRVDMAQAHPPASDREAVGDEGGLVSAPHASHGVVDPPAGLTMQRVADLEDFDPLFPEPARIEHACAALEIGVREERLHAGRFTRHAAGRHMPEGHLLHHYARLHRRQLVGQPVVASSPQGRLAEGAAHIDGRILDEVEAYGKHLFHRFDETVVHVHLGRQGTLLWLPPPPPDAGASVRLRMRAETGAADLIAPLVCELGDGALRDRVVEGLGPDPLRDDADPELVWARIRGSRRPIGALLLDQPVIAGIGNVLRAELLNMTGVHPWLEGSRLPRRTFDALWLTTESVMCTAADEGRIITRRPTGVPPDELDEIEGRFVYKRERCGRCATWLERLEIAGRVIHACPVCQPRDPSGETDRQPKRPV